MKDTFVTGIAELSCVVFGIKNKKDLTEDLKNDPFTEKLVDTVASSLFNEFSYLLAPVSIGSIVAKHKLKEKYDEGEKVITDDEEIDTTVKDEQSTTITVAKAVNETLDQL